MLAGSVTQADRGYHLSRLTGDTSWAKGFEVGKGQSGQDALRHVMHISAYSRLFSKEKATPHGDFYHVVHPSMTTLVCSEALGNGDIEQDGIVWSKRFQEAWDETDIFDLLVKFDPESDGVLRGPNDGTVNASCYSRPQQEMLLHLGQLLYSKFDTITEIFDLEALNDPLASSPDKMSMLSFLHLLKKCNVPHPDVPMAAFDRVFVEVNWSSDPSPDHSGKDMDLGEFIEALIRVAAVRYAVEEPVPDMLESLRMLLEEKIIPKAAETHADPFLGIWHNKDFLTMLAHQGGMLIKAFTCLANVDPDMKFYTMSLKEWSIFVQKLNIAGQGFQNKDVKNTFWRAQGAWTGEGFLGAQGALKEREEFLEKLHATDEQEAADHGNTQEMNYLEFVEGVARVAFQLYVNTLPEDARETIDWKSIETTGALKMQLNFVIEHIKTLIWSGTFA